jgi:beta-mannanase
MAILAAGGSAGCAQSAEPQTCTISSTLVNSCGPWLGAYASQYPQVSSDFETQITYHEQRVGRQMSIVHQYHALGNVTLSSDEVYFIDRANTYMLINWKPADPWVNGAGGDSTVNAQIDEMASSIKAVSPHKVFLSLYHEPENNVSVNNAGLTCALANGASSGSEADYVNMWHNVRTRFNNDGVTNVVWVMIYQGYEKFDPCMTNALWPGNSYVDWVAWDPYDTTANAGWDTTTSYFYNILNSLSNSTYNYKSKPWMLAEYGIGGNLAQSEAYQYYADAKTALDANTYPALKAYVVFDAIGTLYSQVEYGGDPTVFLDTTEQTDYNKLADDSKFIVP